MFMTLADGAYAFGSIVVLFVVVVIVWFLSNDLCFCFSSHSILCVCLMAAVTFKRKREKKWFRTKWKCILKTCNLNFV